MTHMEVRGLFGRLLKIFLSPPEGPPVGALPSSRYISINCRLLAFYHLCPASVAAALAAAPAAATTTPAAAPATAATALAAAAAVAIAPTAAPAAAAAAAPLAAGKLGGEPLQRRVDARVVAALLAVASLALRHFLVLIPVTHFESSRVRRLGHTLRQ
ncbi:hypothetical protein T492DRAFT_316947 [Pavlovales sp. CCMP2436]|nr:hypothetical protein T492DRAFT_316947 [Pavlovales sp. CCMP2436]